MLNKNELIKDFEKEFELERKNFDFNITLDELDEAFNLRNIILEKGFVPNKLVNFICLAIGKQYYDWCLYLNNILLPSGLSYMNQIETKIFSSESDKKLIWELIKKGMEFYSGSHYLDLISDKKPLFKFIDESSDYWKKNFKPKITEIEGRINGAWKEN